MAYRGPVSEQRGDPAVDEKVVAGQRALLEHIVQAAPLPMVLGHVVDFVEGHFAGGATACVMVMDDEEMRLWVASAPHLPREYRDVVDGIPVDLRSASSPFLKGGPVVTSDIAVDERWQPVRTLALRCGLRSCWWLSLSLSDQFLGTLAIYFPDVREPTDSDHAALSMIARTAALAIDRQRVEASRQAARRWESQARDDLQFVLDATTTLAGSLDREQSVRMLAELAVPRLASVAAIDLSDSGEISRAAVAMRDGLPEDVHAGIASHDPRPGSDSPVVRVLESGLEEVVLSQPAWMPADVLEDEAHVEALEVLRATGYACFPLTARGATFGVLSLLATSDHPLEQRVIGLARELADRGSLAIDNAEQYAHRVKASRELEDLNRRLLEAAEAQRKVALALQHAMLPDPPRETAGLEIAVRYRPADDDLAIGGDWFDVLVEPGSASSVSIAVGDVVGKGLSAAGVMGQLRSALRAASYSVDGPAASLRLVDRYARTLAGAFATTVVKVRIDIRSQTLRYASAGHVPPLIVERDGTTCYLTGATRPPLAVSGEGDYVEQRAGFVPGTLLVLYSDGLVERRDRDIDTGLNWLAETVSAHRDEPVDDLVDTVLTASLDGGVARDDTVIVVIRSPSRLEASTTSYAPEAPEVPA